MLQLMSENSNCSNLLIAALTRYPSGRVPAASRGEQQKILIIQGHSSLVSYTRWRYPYFIHHHLGLEV